MKMNRTSQYSQYIPPAKVPEMVQQTAITTLTNEKSSKTEERRKKKTHDITYLYTQISILFLATHNISTHAEINFDMFIYITST